MPIDAKHQSALLGKKVQMSASTFRLAPIRTCRAAAVETGLLGDEIQPGTEEGRQSRAEQPELIERIRAAGGVGLVARDCLDMRRELLTASR